MDSSLHAVGLELLTDLYDISLKVKRKIFRFFSAHEDFQITCSFKHGTVSLRKLLYSYVSLRTM